MVQIFVKMQEACNQHIAMSVPIEVLTYLFQYLSHSDRLAASETCRLWYEAAAANIFRNNQFIYFHKTVFEDDTLLAYENSSHNFQHFTFEEVEINTKLVRFWERIGPIIKTLTLNNCDIREKDFIMVLRNCIHLERLTIISCRELFMSGRLMEGQIQHLETDILEKMKSLSLGGNRYISDSLFNRFVATSSIIEDLDLSSCSISFHPGLFRKFYPFERNENGLLTASESVFTFYFILKFINDRANFLKKLTFSDTLIDGTALERIAEVPGLQLKSLFLNSCHQLTNKGILSLVPHQMTLKELDIGLCSRVTDQSLIAICKYLKTLVYLNIQRCQAVTDIGISHLPELGNLVKLNISLCSSITSDGIEKGLCGNINLKIQELDLNSLLLDESTIIMISEKLPNLRYLNLSYCRDGVTDTSVQALFKNQVWLRSLHLCHCHKITDAGLTGMSQSISVTNSNLECNSPSISPLKISLGSRAEEEIIRDAQRKKIVKTMCENTMKISGYSMSQLKGLRELNVIGCNGITDVSLTYAFIFTELVTINLSYCQQITYAGISCLVRNCSNVENIYLENCYNLDDKCVADIARYLRRLKYLNLKSCNLTDISLEAIKSECCHLKVLDIQGCRNITPELACNLGSLPTLHTIHMSKPGPYISDYIRR